MLDIYECRVVVKIFKGSFQKPMFGLIWVTNTIPPCRDIRIIVRLLAQKCSCLSPQSFQHFHMGQQLPHNFHIINNYKSHMCLKAQNIWFRHKKYTNVPRKCATLTIWNIQLERKWGIFATFDFIDKKIYRPKFSTVSPSRYFTTSLRDQKGNYPFVYPFEAKTGLKWNTDG